MNFETNEATRPEAPSAGTDRMVLPGSEPRRWRPYTLVHISDPHLSRQYYREHFKSFKILLRSITQRNFDHIVITGDLVSTADPSDYYLVRELLKSYGLMDGKKLTVVPGNHDIFGGPHRAIDVLSFPSHIRHVDYRRHLALFEETFNETFSNAVPVIEGFRYPFIKQIGPFGLIGLNSVPPWSLKRNPLGSNGMLDDVQIDGLRILEGNALIEGTVPIAAIHHHFNDLASDASPTHSLWRTIESKTMRMRKRRKVIRLLRNIGVQSVLHGHIHKNEFYSNGDIRFANGAGAVCDDPVPMLKYNTVIFDNGVLTMNTSILGIGYQVSTTSMSFLPSRKHSGQLAPAAAS